MRNPWSFGSLLVLVLLLFNLLAQADESSADDVVDETQETNFNGQVVPPMEFLTGENVHERIKDGYWLIDFYSPYCPHCKALAPVWQTMYEFYYTSDPLAGSSSSQAEALNSFTGYYNFHFAKLDCIAFGDACNSFDILSYPNVRLFRDGKEVDDSMIKGNQVMTKYTSLIESTLESIKPGSRSPDGPKLPAVGDSVSPGYDPSAPKASLYNRMVPLQLPKVDTNVNGISVTLVPDTFADLVGNQKEPWFIKFYAPWCSHCIAMAPHWEAMARSMKDKLNIGEVNCDQTPTLCKSLGINSFPTMMLFRGTDHIEYEGGRSASDLLDFTTQVIEVGTKIVEVNKDSFTRMQASAPVWFVYFFDEASTTEDIDFLDRLILQVASYARIVKTQDKQLAAEFGVTSWPRLAVSRSGRKVLYPGMTPSEMRGFETISTWMKTVRYPLVPEITPANAAALMDDNIVVLTILSRDQPEEMAGIQKSLLDTALAWTDIEEQALVAQRAGLRFSKADTIREAKSRGDSKAAQSVAETPIRLGDYANRPVQFAWVDGGFWQRWILSSYGIDTRETGLAVIINDEKNHRFWDKSVSGEILSTSRSTLLETLPLVVTRPPLLSPRSSRSGPVAWYFNTRAMFEERPTAKWFLFAVFVSIGAIIYRRSRGRRGSSSGRRPVGLPGPNGAAHTALFDPEKFSMSSLWGRQPNGKAD